MQKKDVVLVEVATYVFTCQNCGAELHIKNVKSEKEAITRAEANGWFLDMNEEVCRRCNYKDYLSECED